MMPWFNMGFWFMCLQLNMAYYVKKILIINKNPQTWEGQVKSIEWGWDEKKKPVVGGYCNPGMDVACRRRDERD